MRSLRRKRESDADAAAEAPRMSWSARRHGQDLIISVIPSRVAGDQSFRPVDVLPEERARSPEERERDGGAGDEGATGGAAAEMVASLTRAARGPETVAIQGFAARPSSGNVLTFTLAISLADIPYPEAGELPEGDVSDCRLPCGPGIRIFRMVEPGTDPGAPPIALFSTTYLAQTDFGVLALAFATPHVDGAREFAVLFESIAGSCEIQPAPAAEASAT